MTESDAGDDTDPPAAELAIAGSVLDQDGTPLADIAVSAVRHDAGSAPGPATATATSDRLGMFRLPDLTAGEYLLEAEGGPDRHSARLQVRAGAAAVELVLRARAERIVHGQVRNALGDPLADVRVHSPGGPPGTRTDAGGKYRIGVISRESGQAPVLDFELAGYRSRRLRVQGEAPEVRMDVDLEAAAPPATVLGSVYGPRGEAVADALVWLASPATGAYHQVTSDIAGEYRIDGVEAGSGYQLGVEPPDGYRARTLGPLTLQTPTAMHDIRLESRGEAGLIGRLVDPDGRPLAGFPLWLRSADAGNVTVPVTTDASGRFHAEPVPAGQVHLQTASQPRLRAGSIQLDSGQVRSVEIPLDWGEEWMFGRVVDARDLPVAGARLTLQWSVPVAEFTSTSLRHATTDPDGHFAFANLGARDYRLTVQAPGRETYRQFTRRNGEDLLIRLPGSSGG